MDHHRPQSDTPRSNVAPDEETSKAADGQVHVPAWNRERLIRQFQHIDGSTRGEAERQLDGYEQSFRTAFGSRPIAGGRSNSTVK